MMDLAHVMALEPAKQDALWLMLYNLHGMFMLSQMQKVEAKEGGESATARHSMVMSNFDQCLELMRTLDDVRRHGSRKTRTFFFSPRAMETISLSLQAYDEKHNCLNESDNVVVRVTFPTLRDLIATSLQHCYTREELRKAGIK